MKKQLVLLKKDLPEYNLKTGTMGLVDSLEKNKVDVLFFEIKNIATKETKIAKCDQIDRNNLIRIEDFYTTNRLKSDSIWVKILLCIYSPIGILLAVSRLLLGILILGLTQILPFLKNDNNFVVFFSYLGGFIPVIENKEEFNKSKAKVVVSNHISLLDHTAFQPFNKVYALSTRMLEQNLLYKTFFSILGGGLVQLRKNESIKELEKRIDILLKEEPFAKMLIFPEGTVHNGRFLHFFHSFAFSLSDSVLPATLRIFSIFPICYYPFGKNQVFNLLWIIFLPFNFYHCKLLPTVYRRKDETYQEFAYRVQQIIASDLNITGTNVTNKLKHLYTANREFYKDFIKLDE